jgi:hypothetical protein
MIHNNENITKLSLIAFKTKDIYVAYDLLHNYYRDKIGRDFPIKIETLKKEKTIAVDLLRDLIVQGHKIENELSNAPDWFNLNEFKTLLRTAYQNLNFETAMVEFKERWMILHNTTFPYPLWDHYDDYMMLVNELNIMIVENSLFKPKQIERVNKTYIIKKYKWSKEMFQLFYP